jgi:hypothetical protein
MVELQEQETIRLLLNYADQEVDENTLLILSCANWTMLV